MSECRLTPIELADALQKGLGRAVQHVRRHGDEGVRDELLHACLHAVGYDPQCEGRRSAWLMGMLDHVEEIGFYRDALLARLATYEGDDDGSFWDWTQLVELALHFAQRGVEAARPLIYRAHERAMDTSGSWLGVEEILTLDGLAGLDHVVRLTGQAILAGEGDANDRGGEQAVEAANDLFGADVVEAHLHQRAEEDVAIGAFVRGVEGVESSRAEYVARRRPSPADRLLEALESPLDAWELETGDVHIGLFMRAGREASADQLEAVFARLLVQQDPAMLRRHLAVFRRRPLPRLHPRLMELVRHTDEEVADAAACALRHTSDPRLETAMLWLYESGPCQTCRQWAVEHLLTWHRLPPHLAAECLDDANEDTRTLVGERPGT